MDHCFGNVFRDKNTGYYYLPSNTVPPKYRYYNGVDAILQHYIRILELDELIKTMSWNPENDKFSLLNSTTKLFYLTLA